MTKHDTTGSFWMRAGGLASAVVGAWLVAATACLTKPPAPSFDDTEIDMVCSARAAAICTLRESCGSDSGDFENTKLYGSDMVCVKREALVCNNVLHVTDVALTFEDETQCTMAFTSAETCSNLHDNVLPPHCTPPPGPGSTGSPCANNAQCASTFCAVPSNQICGTCGAPPQPGTTCTVESQCGGDLTCYTASGSSSGSCLPFANDGANCRLGSNVCVSGDACLGGTTTVVGTCTAEGSMGASCDPTNQTGTNCYDAEGWVCLQAPSGSGGSSGSDTCQLAQFAGPHEPCGVIVTGSGRYLAECAASGLCVKSGSSGSGSCMPASADGGMCSIGADGPPCLTPAVCVVGADGLNGTCQVPDPAACF
jgi:hypothetical protein